jgi:hypothetical protein
MRLTSSPRTFFLGFTLGFFLSGMVGIMSLFDKPKVEA